MFNTFVNTFRRKLLTLLDDVEQFFLWVVVAALDGRKTNLEQRCASTATGLNGNGRFNGTGIAVAPVSVAASAGSHCSCR